MGGVFLYASQPQPVGTQLTVKLSWPCRDEALQLPGKVVRIATREQEGAQVPYGMGIQFVDLDDDTRGALEGFLAEYGQRAPRGVAAVASDDNAALHKEAAALRERLWEVTQQNEALHRELEAFEQQDEANRSVVAHLFEEAERLRLANQQEATRVTGQMEHVSAMFDQKLKEALALAEANHERVLSEQTLEARALLLTELEEQLFVEQARAAESEAQLRQDTDAAEERVRELEAGYKRNRREFESSLEDGQRETQDLLLDLAEEQNSLDEAKARIAELEGHLVYEIEQRQGAQAREAELRRSLGARAELEGEMIETGEASTTDRKDRLAS